MTREKDERWRMPELERLGERFRATEIAERESAPASWWRRRRSWLRRGLAGLLGVIGAAVGVLEVVAPAGANSPVNRAPLAAERAKTARFVAEQNITVGDRRITEVRETGALDFGTGAFATTLNVLGTSEPFERRRVGEVLYFRRGGAGPAGMWTATRVERGSLRSFAAPGGYSLVDPEVVFRVMTDARSPVAVLGSRGIDGTRAMGYRTSTSLRSFLAAERGQSVSELTASDPAATLTTWLDSMGRPRRVEARFAGASRLGPVTMTTVVDFAKYGAPVDVRPPPAAELRHARGYSSGSALGDPVRALERILFGIS